MASSNLVTILGPEEVFPFLGLKIGMYILNTESKPQFLTASF